MSADEGGDGWQSLLVEILRFGAPTGSIQPEERYLVTCGTERVRKYEMELTTKELRAFLKELRAVANQPEAQRRDAREQVMRTVTDILRQDPPARRCQIDLVVNYREIMALPFELANASDGRPLLVERDPPVVLTRRVRGAFREHTPRWPSKPRVLLIASSPDRDVPFDDHKQAMRVALSPWIEPLEGFEEAVPHEELILTKLENASLPMIARECASADPPYTHVHVVAHGCVIGDEFEAEYALELAAEGGNGSEAVTGPRLAEALAGGKQLPTVVTLTACDSANVGSPVVEGSIPAHAVHESGVPVVVASQFPMTFAGSALTVASFYGSLFAGDDVRDALLATRAALHADAATTQHDWMSLVAYVQLPEGYQDRLLDVRVAADLASLKTAQAWADHLIAHSAAAGKYDQVVTRLNECIGRLQRWELEAVRLDRVRLREECRGLLGSAHKRLAELHHQRAQRANDPEPWMEQSKLALDAAACWYRLAFAENLSAHWVGVQELSLEAVTTGRIDDAWRWSAAMHAAKGHARSAEEALWKCGSAAELHLLAPYAGQPEQLGEAAEALATFARLAPRDDPFPIASTARQLGRYIHWWTQANGYFPEAGDRAAAAASILPAGWKT